MAAVTRTHGATMRSRLLPLLLLLIALLAAACGGDEPTAETTQSPGTGEGAEPTATDDGTAGDPGAVDFRIAGVFPGSTTDADYNTLGLLALQSAESGHGAETAFSENVPVPDVERVMREYLSEGFNVIWTHGGQFFEQTMDLARQNPDVFFIGEFDGPAEDPPDNLWVIDRQFHVGFYPLGALAAKVTQTGKIGYIGGLSLPFSYSEVHAMQQAIDDLEADVELVSVWTGDFNDPAAARQTASQMLSQGVDVIVGSLNLGMVGVFEAVKQAGSGEVWATAKYTDKSQFAPEHYVTSVIYDFEGPLDEILNSIRSGETGGYYPLGFDTGVALQTPLQNIDESVASEVEEIIEDVRNGTIEVTKDTTPIE